MSAAQILALSAEGKKLKALQEQWGSLKPEDFSKEDLKRLFKNAPRIHVAFAANEYAPMHSMALAALRNSEPAYEAMTAGFAGKLGPEVKVLSLHPGRALKWLTGKKVSALSPNEIVLVPVSEAFSKEFAKNTDLLKEAAKQERLVFDALKSVPWEGSQLEKAMAKKLIEGKVPPAPYDLIILGMGFLQGLDPHSYLIPQAAFNSGATPSKELVGVGITMRLLTNGSILITDVIDGGPASESGLAPGDQILEIDKSKLTPIKDLTEVIRRIRDEPGTRVEFKIKRGTAEFDVSLVRRQVTYSDVRVNANFDGEQTPWIGLSRFSKGITDLVRKGIASSGGAHSPFWVIDLRQNPGGFVNEAVGLVETLATGNFVGENVFYLLSGTGFTGFEKVSRSPLPLPRNLIVLADNHSASASEIFAGNLKSMGNALIIGTRTYGKGTAQGIVPIGNETIYMGLTIGIYFNRDHRSPQFTGVTPHFDSSRHRQAFLGLNPEDVEFESDKPGALRPLKGAGTVSAIPDSYPATLKCLEALDAAGSLIDKEELLNPIGAKYGIEGLIAIQAMKCANSVGEVK